MTTGMVLECIDWIIVFAAFTGIGAFVLRVLGRRLDGAESVLDGFWFGFALTIGTLQIWQLMWPIGPPTLAAVLGVGAIGLFVASRAASSRAAGSSSSGGTTLLTAPRRENSSAPTNSPVKNISRVR